MERVHVVLGDTARAPNQGATIASGSIQIHAAPLRLAAAQVRAWLLAQAAEHWDCKASELRCAEGQVEHAAKALRLPYGALLQARHTALLLDPQAQPKDPKDHRLVGTRAARVDITAKATGETVFVHDMRVPGMLHGRVVRPPYAGADHGDFIGNSLESVDETSVAHIPGLRAVVVLRESHRATTTEQDILDWCREHMAVYKCPRTVEFVAALPKSGSGKVMWRLLQEQEARKSAPAQ